MRVSEWLGGLGHVRELRGNRFRYNSPFMSIVLITYFSAFKLTHCIYVSYDFDLHQYLRDI